VKFENENGRLGIITTKDQDPIVGAGEIPIFGVDMWEHAYYLQVRFINTLVFSGSC
jgi:Fe-Mn family superoxide dismutase